MKEELGIIIIHSMKEFYEVLYHVYINKSYGTNLLMVKEQSFYTARLLLTIWNAFMMIDDGLMMISLMNIKPSKGVWFWYKIHFQRHKPKISWAWYTKQVNTYSHSFYEKHECEYTKIFT